MNFKLVLLFSAGILFLPSSSHAEEASAWITADFVTHDGQSGEMVFNNPKHPDMTLQECKDSLEYALPMIKENVEKLAMAEFVSAKCVWSTGDPIKPTN